MTISHQRAQEPHWSRPRIASSTILNSSNSHGNHIAGRVLRTTMTEARRQSGPQQDLGDTPTLAVRPGGVRGAPVSKTRARNTVYTSLNASSHERNPVFPV